MTLLAGRAITESFGSRLILDGASLSVEPLARTRSIPPRHPSTPLDTVHVSEADAVTS